MKQCVENYTAQLQIYLLMLLDRITKYTFLSEG